MIPGLVEIRWKPAALAAHGLPDIGYPVPFALLPEMLEQGGELPFAAQLYWLQEHARDGKADWEALEPAMLRLAELISEPDDRDSATVSGDDWFLELAPLDPGVATVTVQRRDQLLAGIQSRADGRLKVAVYRALAAKSIRYLIAMSCNPNEHGEVCMRPNNWEYALDHSCKFSSFYACDRGEAYLSLWQQGMGKVDDGSIDEDFLEQASSAPVPLHIAATMLGVYYMQAPED